MLKNIYNVITEYNLIEPHDIVVCGVSGGPDSMCLIDVLRRIREAGWLDFDLVIAHVNHLIRPDATDDELFVKEYADKHNIPFFAKRVKVAYLAKVRKMGLEETGRDVRYAFFARVMEKTGANKIATAHTKSDNAETVLMNIIRGTGLTGLCGIQPKRDNIFIKPLIRTMRCDIEAYCEENKLNPRIDSTNKEVEYTRNKTRNILIPILQKGFSPNIIDTIDRLSDIAYEENSYIEEETKKAYREILIKETEYEVVLNLKQFNTKHRAIRSRIIIMAIRNTIGTINNIQNIHIKDIIKLCENNIGNKYLTPNKNIKVLVNKGEIHFMSQKNNK